MKQSLLVAALIALAATACSKQEEAPAVEAAPAPVVEQSAPEVAADASAPAVAADASAPAEQSPAN